MSNTTTVYVELLDEGVDAWRPVLAQPVSGDVYRLIGEIPDGETWLFAPGDLVRCELRPLMGDDNRLERVLVASQRVT